MTAKEWVLQLLFPRRCPVCDEIAPFGEKICLECLKKLNYITQPWCMKCGKKLREEKEYCGDCTGRRHNYVRGRALYEYKSVAGSLYRFKYGGRREYADFYGEEAARYLKGFLDQIKPDGLVPVPLHPKRYMKRGYNQAFLLAKVIGKHTGIPVYDKLVRRQKETRPLKMLNPTERQNNLKNAFHIAQNDVKLKVVLVIDDIYTTGSTIDAVAAELKKAGAQKVYFITLACGAGI